MSRDSQPRLTPGTRVVQAGGQVWSDLEDEVAILHVERGRYYGLNPVGARIWRLLEEERTLEQLETALLLADYEVEPDVLRRDIETLLQRMSREGLVVLNMQAEGGP